MSEPIALTREGKAEVVAYVCGACNVVVSSNLTHATMEDAKRLAENHCKPRVCDCGAECDRFYTACRGCIDRKQAEKDRAVFDAARKVKWSDYKDARIYINDDPMETCDVGHEFYDHAPDKRPAYGFAVLEKNGVPKIDAQDIAERALEETYEDAIEAVDVDGLQKVIDEWREAQGFGWYECDYDTVVLLDELWAEVDAEKAAKVADGHA